MTKWNVKGVVEDFQVTAATEATARSRAARQAEDHTALSVTSVPVTPPPPTDAPPYLQSWKFPRNPGPAGTMMSRAQIGDFDSLAVHAGSTDRVQWVADPLGSGVTVARLRIESGDHTGAQPSDHRCEIYNANRDIPNRAAGWLVLGFMVPASNPSSRYGIFQNHAVGDARQNTPPQNLNVAGGRLYLGIRKIGVNRTFHDVGSARADEWHYVAIHIRFTEDESGFIEVWTADGDVPDVSQAPDFSDHGYSTLNGGRENTRSHIGFYEGGSFAGTVYYSGYSRAASYGEALGLLTVA